MKALSLWQPWATAIAVGAKRVETRHWATAYRGPLAIHAAKRRNVDELIHYHSCWNWQGALRPVGWSWRNHSRDEIRAGFGLPFGAIVATCELIDCRPTASFTVAELHTQRRPEGEKSDSYNWTESQMGNFELGRFGWILANIRPTRWPDSVSRRAGVVQCPRRADRRRVVRGWSIRPGNGRLRPEASIHASARLHAPTTPLGRGCHER